MARAQLTATVDALRAAVEGMSTQKARALALLAAIEAAVDAGGIAESEKRRCCWSEVVPLALRFVSPCKPSILASANKN